MLEALTDELAKVGLDLNAKKTKIFTTDEAASKSEAPCLVEVSGEFVEVVQRENFHKYLGNAVPGDLQRRGQTMLSHRIRCAWAKYHTFKPHLTDKHVDVGLRLKLFHSIVTPSALYGLSSAPLTQRPFHSLSVLQRKMLRNIVGHVRVHDDNWSDYHKRMNERIARALDRQAVPDWAEELLARKEKLYEKVVSGRCSALVSKVCDWCPRAVSDPKLSIQPRRERGRPCTRWNELLL